MDTKYYMSHPCRCRTKKPAHYPSPQQALVYYRREQSGARRRALPTEGPECRRRRPVVEVLVVDVQNTGDRRDRGGALLEHIGSGQAEQLLQGTV
jgi:hypothetical protein